MDGKNDDGTSDVSPASVPINNNVSRWSSYWHFLQLLLLAIVISVAFVGVFRYTGLIYTDNSINVSLWAMWPLETILFSYKDYFWNDMHNVEESATYTIKKLKHWKDFYSDKAKKKDNTEYKSDLDAMPAAKFGFQCYATKSVSEILSTEHREDKDVTSHSNTSMCWCLDTMTRNALEDVLVVPANKSTQVSNMQYDEIKDYIDATKMSKILKDDRAYFNNLCGWAKSNDEKWTFNPVSDADDLKLCYFKIIDKAIDTCQIVSMPNIVKHYSGFINLPLCWIFGQSFVLFSMLQHAVLDNLPAASDKRKAKYLFLSSPMLKQGIYVVYFFCSLALVISCVLALYHVVEKPNYDEEKYESITGGKDKNSKLSLDALVHTHGSGYVKNRPDFLLVTSFILLAVYILCELLWLLVTFQFCYAEFLEMYFGKDPLSTVKDSNGDELELVDVNKFMFWQQIRCDLPFVFGVTILFATYQMQAGEQNLHTIIFIVLLTLSLGVMHHICNMLRAVWNVLSQIFVLNSSTAVTHTEEQAPQQAIAGAKDQFPTATLRVDPQREPIPIAMPVLQDEKIEFERKNMNKILSFVFWTRVYAISLIVLCVYFYIFNVQATPTLPNKATAYFKGMIPYVATLLLCCILLPEIAWELAPGQFKNMQDQWRKRTFLLCAFILYLNWKQFIWVQHNVTNFRQETSHFETVFNVAPFV